MHAALPLLTSEPRVSPCGREIDVQFGAGTARAGVAHHPEIVLLVAVDDVDGGIEPGGAEIRRPDGRTLPGRIRSGRLWICRASRPWRRGGSGGNFQTLDDQFPRPVDRFLFEVIAEAPVAEHLEKGVVIGVEADVSRSLCLPPARMHFWVSAARGGL